MIFTCTTQSSSADLNGKTWIDGQHGTTERIAFLAAMLDPGETLTVTITEGIAAAPQDDGGPA